MFPEISIKHDMDKLMAWSQDMAANQVDFAAALTLTKTGQDVKARFEDEIRAVVDRPTPYTMRGMRLFPARKDKLEARVAFRSAFSAGDEGRNYLGPQVFGGRRHAKGLEVALRAAGHLPAGWLVVPGQGARLDKFGNVDRGQVIQVLSQLRITLTAGYSRNMSFDARKQIAAQRKAGGRFYVVRPDSGQGTPGVYQREFLGRSTAPVFIFVRSASYRVRLPFHVVAQQVVRDRLAPNFALAWSQAKATARGGRR